MFDYIYIILVFTYLLKETITLIFIIKANDAQNERKNLCRGTPYLGGGGCCPRQAREAKEAQENQYKETCRDTGRRTHYF